MEVTRKWIRRALGFLLSAAAGNYLVVSVLSGLSLLVAVLATAVSGLPLALAALFLVAVLVLCFGLLLLLLNLLVPRSWLSRAQPEPAEAGRHVGPSGREGWIKPEDLGEYLQSINQTMEEHGFGRNPNVAPTSEPKEATPSWEELNRARERRYQENRGLFLIHTWEPSDTRGQVVDVVIRLSQHGPGPLAAGQVRAVEYTLGPKFTKHSLVCTEVESGFAIEVRMWGQMLCLAKVYFIDGSSPLLLERYINFEENAAPLAGGPQVDRLIVHQLSVLRSELQHLHFLFTTAREATSDLELDAVEQTFKTRIEHTVRHELAVEGDLLAHFWDDTGTPQPTSGERKEKMTTFLQRRHTRLKEVIERLSRRL